MIFSVAFPYNLWCFLKVEKISFYIFSLMSSEPETHKLNNPWCLWYCPTITSEMIKQHKDPSKASKIETRIVDRINTVEEMWCIFKSLPPCMKLPPGDFIMYFREGLAPFWEDPGFKVGGRIRFKLDPTPTADTFISLTLAHIFGEAVSLKTCPNIIGGIRYTRRDKLRDQFVQLEVWITDNDFKEFLLEYFKTLAAEADIHNLEASDNMAYTKF